MRVDTSVTLQALLSLIQCIPIPELNEGIPSYLLLHAIEQHPQGGDKVQSGNLSNVINDYRSAFMQQSIRKQMKNYTNIIIICADDVRK